MNKSINFLIVLTFLNHSIFAANAKKAGDSKPVKVFYRMIFKFVII